MKSNKIKQWRFINGRRVPIQPKKGQKLLPFNEYKKVQSEINTYHTKYKEGKTYTQAIGNNVYKFKYNGFDNFTILGKRRIK